ncbi:MAG: lipoyl(octanoyl) transferase LipB [Candidatus Hydrothermales bacterium]
MKKIEIFNLGMREYKEIWNFQKVLVEKRSKDIIGDTLILCEHFPVYTTGARGNKRNLLVDESLLKAKGIMLYHVERGGDITFHGPGQLVAYPIIKLVDALIGIKKFVYNLEEVVMRTLKEYKIEAERLNNNIGVFVKEKKIASIGVAVKKGVTFHGLAFNINMDLSYFKLIRPCGLDVEMTDLSKELNREINLEEVTPLFIEKFKEVFEYN